MLCPGQRALADSEAQILSSSHDLEVEKQIKAVLVLPPHQLCHCVSLNPHHPRTAIKMFAEVLYLKANVSSIDVKDLPLSFLLFLLSCLVEICLDKLDKRGESVWSFQDLLGKIRRCDTMGVAVLFWGAECSADGIDWRHQAPVGTAPATGREQVPLLRREHG